MTVNAPDGTQVYEWNGKPEDRAVAKAAFDEAMATGAYLAYAVHSPGRASAIREFDPEIEEIELAPNLVGG